MRVIIERSYVPIKPIQKELVYAKIADAIIEYISINNFKNGDKLPPERILAERFATSRNSVREALKVLEANKVIEIRPGSGSFITSREETNSFFIKLWEINYIELLDVKQVLEESLILELCGKLTEVQLKQLEEPLRQIEMNAEQGVYSHKADNVFHSMLWSFSSNKTMIKLLDNLFNALRSYWRTLKDEESIWISTIPFHRQLFEGLKTGQWTKARKGLLEIYRIDKNITKWLEEASQPFKEDSYL